jgi:hypothetical protein
MLDAATCVAPYILFKLKEIKKERGFFCGPTYLISCLAGGCTLFPFSLIFHQNYLCKTKISKNFFNKGKHRKSQRTFLTKANIGAGGAA